MDWLPLLLHASRLAHGLAACLVVAAVFVLAGLAVIPRKLDAEPGAVFAYGFAGAALYVGACWFAIAQQIPVKSAALAFALLAVVLALVRYRRVAAFVAAGSLTGRGARSSWLGFTVLYVLAYAFTMPPVSDEYLPVAWTGNIDLLTYLRYSQHLLTLGPSNVANFSYLNYIYLQTPGLFSLMGGLSLLFAQEPMSAAMPMQFGLLALIGTTAATISRSVFGLSTPAAFAVSGMFIAGPFFRYIAANYFLSTLLAMPLLLYVVWVTVDAAGSRASGWSVAARLAGAYLLLLLVYPFLLFATLGLQLAAVILTTVSALPPRGNAPPLGRAALRGGQVLLTAYAVFGIIAAAFWRHVVWSAEMVTALAERGVAGWPLDLISPAALFGWPGRTAGAMQVPVEAHGWAMAVLVTAAILLLAAHYWWFRRVTTPAQSAFAGLLAGAIGLYVLYYLANGESYQQWKFASYTVLPLSFVLYAAALNLLRVSPLSLWASRTAQDRRLLNALPAFVAFAFVAGNAAAHAAVDDPLRRLPSRLRAVKQVSDMPQFRELTVRMSDAGDPLSAWVALYYLPDKRVQVVSSHFRPSVRLELDAVTRQRPLLMHNYDCSGIGHGDTQTIDGFGCLVFSPPSLIPGTRYPFNRTYLFIDYDGMTAREPGGRWNRRPTLPLRILADPERASLGGEMYLNLFVNPFLPEGVAPQRLVVRTGSGVRGEIAVADQEWLSVPIRTADWKGNRLWTLELWIDFPDGRTILFHELSVTAEPYGRLISPSVGSAR